MEDAGGRASFCPPLLQNAGRFCSITMAMAMERMDMGALDTLTGRQGARGKEKRREEKRRGD